MLGIPDWPGHIAGQHVDVRLTADDGYQTERSFSIASPPEQATVALTVERIDGGEVSPYLTEELRVGDELELRGPFTSYFVWRNGDGGPLLLIAGGSGLVPLRAGRPLHVHPGSTPELARIRAADRRGDGQDGRTLSPPAAAHLRLRSDRVRRAGGRTARPTRSRAGCHPHRAIRPNRMRLLNRWSRS